MDILSKIISYFSQVSGFYKNSQEIFDRISATHKLLSSAIDCDIFHPSGNEILKIISDEDSELYNSIIGVEKATLLKNSNSGINSSIIENSNNDFVLTELLDLTEYLRDEAIANQQNTPIDFNDISKLDSLLVELANMKKSNNSCLDLEIDNNIRQEEIEAMAKLIQENGVEEIDAEVEKILQACRNKEELSSQDLSFEQFTLNEILKAKENCFDGLDVPDDNQEVPLETIQNLKDPFSETTSIEDDKSDNIPKVEFSEETYNLLIDLMGSEKSQCFSEMKRLADEMQEISNEYTQHISKKIDLEKKYAYNRLFFAMYDEYKKVFGQVAGALVIPSSSNFLFDSTLEDYSKEIGFKTSTFSKSNNFRLVELKINTKKSPDSDDGAYFEAYEKVQKLLKASKFKNGKATQEDWESVDEYSKKIFEATLNQYEAIVRDSAKNNYFAMVAGLGLKAPFVLTENSESFEKLYTQLKLEWNQIQTEYLNYEIKSKDYVQSLLDKGNEMVQVSEELGCSDQSKIEIEDEVEELDIDSEGDFRGIPDPEKPNIHDKSYWKRVASMATVVGLAPIPQFFGSNEFRMNFRDYTNPSVKIPNGSPAIDDDGIPRFLFYPIGFIIPTPFSADFIYRIPLPMIWKFLFVTKISSPLAILVEKLMEYSSIFGGLDMIRRSLTRDVHPNVIWRELPNGVVESIMTTLGLDDSIALNFARKQANDLTSSFKNGLDDQLRTIATGVISKYNGDTNEVDKVKEDFARDSQEEVVGIRNKAQSFLNTKLASTEQAISKELKNMDSSQWLNTYQGFVSTLETYVNTATDIVGSVNSCIGYDLGLDFSLDANNFLDNLKKIGPSIGDISGLRFPSLNIPILDLGEYLEFNLDLGLDFSFDTFDDFLSNLDSLNFFPKLKQLINIISDYITEFYLAVIKFKLWDIGFPIEQFLDIEIPSDLVSSLSLTMIDFPDMILVGFLGISGVIPYPFMLLINPSNKSVPGLIDERTIEFVVTLDFADPIKVIKKNFGSYTLPIRTHIEDLINASLGLYYNPTDGRTVNTCDIIQNIEGLLNSYGRDISGLLDRLGGLDQIVLDILGDIKGNINFDFKPKDLYNLFELPNPNLLCKLNATDSFKSQMESILSGTKLNSTFIPPSFSKIYGFEKYGLPNWNGQFNMDEFKDTFNVDKFPNASDILPFGENMRKNLLLNELGQSKKMIFDLIPQLTVKTPFLQDDLPTWERLQWWNVPFIAFLIEFNIAAKRGAKFPIPEVISSLNM